MGKHTQTKDMKKNVKNTKRNDNSKKATKKANSRNVDDSNINTNSKVVNKKNIKKKKKKHPILLIVLILVIAFGIFAGIRLWKAQGNWLGAILGHDKDTLANLDKLQILILGESTGMSDTIIVASYDPKTQDASLLSIPRDTFTGSNVSSANYYHKINALYSHGETPEKTLEAVNKITGLNVQYYILVDTEALIELVDIIGGLDFNVPINMNYDDSTQNLHIHLSEGNQHLTGAQVEQLVRFRHNNNGTSYPTSYGWEDYGRMHTQRDVVIALAKQSFKLKNITEISNIIDTLKKYVKTNIDLDSIKDYLPYIEIDKLNVKAERIPGYDDIVNGIWFFFYDEEGTKELVDELFYGIMPSDSVDGNNVNNDDENVSSEAE